MGLAVGCYVRIYKSLQEVDRVFQLCVFHSSERPNETKHGLWWATYAVTLCVQPSYSKSHPGVPEVLGSMDQWVNMWQTRFTPLRKSSGSLKRPQGDLQVSTCGLSKSPPPLGPSVRRPSLSSPHHLQAGRQAKRRLNRLLRHRK